MSKVSLKSDEYQVSHHRLTPQAKNSAAMLRVETNVDDKDMVYFLRYNRNLLNIQIIEEINVGRFVNRMQLTIENKTSSI